MVTTALCRFNDNAVEICSAPVGGVRALPVANSVGQLDLIGLSGPIDFGGELATMPVAPQQSKDAGIAPAPLARPFALPEPRKYRSGSLHSPVLHGNAPISGLSDLMAMRDDHHRQPAVVSELVQ